MDFLELLYLSPIPSNGVDRMNWNQGKCSLFSRFFFLPIDWWLGGTLFLQGSFGEPELRLKWITLVKQLPLTILTNENLKKRGFGLPSMCRRTGKNSGPSSYTL